MRIAIVVDIHSNAPAFEAVLADIDHQGVDEVVVVGDFLNGGPFPREVLDMLYDRQPRALLGNHERYIQILSNPDQDKSAHPRSRWGVAYWTLDYMRETDLAYLNSLPITIEQDKLLFVHGSPKDLRGGILPDTSEDFLQEHFGEVQYPYVITAHTHRPFVRQWGDLTFINPGSVGMPLDCNPDASYAILTRSNGHVDVKHRRIPYNQQLVEQAAYARGLMDMGPIAALMVHESVTGRPVVVEYLERLEAAMSELGLSEDEAMAQIPLLD
ncbi:MAG: DNA methylase [Chloroflexota bacterium]|nr:metallophosphoesterase [Chloroflexota bacterium]NOG63388.1 metallophosphoesterase family protein [Chloroflexota bacterium]GIK62248.1 MAG: DNA methylase [Chloroflexota bacterium]